MPRSRPGLTGASSSSTVRMLRTFELSPMIALNFPARLLVTMPLRVMHVDPLAREGEGSYVDLRRVGQAVLSGAL